jgi:hypothetical protein
MSSTQCNTGMCKDCGTSDFGFSHSLIYDEDNFEKANVKEYNLLNTSENNILEKKTDNEYVITYPDPIIKYMRENVIYRSNALIVLMKSSSIHMSLYREFCSLNKEYIKEALQHVLFNTPLKKPYVEEQLDVDVCIRRVLDILKYVGELNYDKYVLEKQTTHDYLDTNFGIESTIRNDNCTVSMLFDIIMSAYNIITEETRTPLTTKSYPNCVKV